MVWSFKCGVEDVAWLEKQYEFDLTPVQLKFGRAADLLRPVCKYFWRLTPAAAGLTNQKWIKLSYDEYQARGGGREPAKGTIEMCAQRQRIFFAYPSKEKSDFVVVEKAEPVIGPLFTGEDNAGIFWRLLEEGQPHFNLAAMEDVLAKIPLIDISILGDLDAGNVRMKYHLGEFLAKANRRQKALGSSHRFLLSDLSCTGHIFHAFVAGVCKTSYLMPRLHGVAFICRQCSFYERLLKALDRLLERDLEDGFFPGQAPPLACREHSEKVFAATFQRLQYTQGGADSHVPMGEEEISEISETGRELLNGFLWVRFSQHFCWRPGCCGGQNKEVCKQRLLSWYDCAVFRKLASVEPSENRWWTMQLVLVASAASFLLHRIGPRVFEALGSNFSGDADEEEAPGDDAGFSWKAHFAKQEKRLHEFMCEQEAQSETVVLAALVSTEALDKCSSQLQHLDANSNSISFSQNDTGPVAACLIHLSAVLDPVSPVRRAAIVWPLIIQHFSEERERVEEVLEEVVRQVQSFSAQVDARVWRKLNSWPSRLLQAGDPSRALGEREATMKAFYDEFLCCLDSWWCEPFREAVPTLEQCKSPSVQSFLQHKGRRGKMTNMGMEGLLAKYRQSVPTRKYYPFLETLAFSSTLSDLFERHLDLGFTNPLRLTQAQLKKAGVPMPRLSSKRAREQRGKIQTNTSKHFFMQTKKLLFGNGQTQTQPKLK